MRLRSLTTFALAASAMITAFACSADSPAAPKSNLAPTDTSSALLGLGIGKQGTFKVIPMLRSTPLPSDVVVTKTIGLLGGTITIPQAGLTLVVPPLAVGKNTNFKITARKGSFVAYDMEPHGTRFTLPLVATQSLVNTNAHGLLNVNLQLGYYTDPSKITTVSELLGVQIDALRLTSISLIPHFSGYIYVSGREDSFNEEF